MKFASLLILLAVSVPALAETKADADAALADVTTAQSNEQAARTLALFAKGEANAARTALLGYLVAHPNMDTTITQAAIAICGDASIDIAIGDAQMNTADAWINDWATPNVNSAHQAYMMQQWATVVTKGNSAVSEYGSAVAAEVIAKTAYGYAKTTCSDELAYLHFLNGD